MATGGATWDTAGTLDIGSGNTFTVADAVSSDYIGDDAWWTFTLTSPSRVDLVSSPHSNFALYQGATEGDAELVSAIEADGSEGAGVTAYYLLPPGTYHLVVGVFGTPPTTYTVTYTPRLTGSSPWNSDLRDDPDNVIPITDDEPDWPGDVIRLGSYRVGDAWIQEGLGGPWDALALDCAEFHAQRGEQIGPFTWDGICPTPSGGPAELEVVGGSSVEYQFSEGTAFPWPFIPNSARIIVRTLSWGIWLKPVEDNLPPFGVLTAPNPVDYGYPADAVIEYEFPTVELVGLEIADRAGTLGDDPNSSYAVNHNRQPDFSAGTWGPWALGVLPGDPLAPPVWADGPEGTSVVFSSEGVADVDKTRHPLDVPADGFASLAQDYTNDPYDYGVVAGPTEAFGGTISAGRTAPVGITLYVQVRSPRFRFIYDAPTTLPPRRIFGRPDGATHGAARVLGGGNTAQSGTRTLGNIL